MAGGKWQNAKGKRQKAKGLIILYEEETVAQVIIHLPGDAGHVSNAPCPAVMIDAELTN